MREIFYIPEGGIVDDYSEQWKGRTSLVQVGLSANIEEYVTNPELAQFILIPEYQHMDIPRNISNQEFFTIIYWDDFETIKQEKPEATLEQWSKNLDDPTEESVHIETYPMHYEVGRNCYISNHLKLDVGWWDMVVKIDGKTKITKEISVWESTEEE